MPDPDLKSLLRERYGALAVAQATPAAGCCAPATSCCGDRATGANEFSFGLYESQDLAGVPQSLLAESLGCGNPLALADVREGETVIDLGCGAGLDALLAAKRVGPAGHVYGVDLTDQMLDRAWTYARASGVGNVTFVRGDAEAIPAPSGSVDLVISNCVINLAGDKDRVFAEIHRILVAGGRLAVSDVVVVGGLDDVAFAPALRADLVAWGSCIAGALGDRDYLDKLTAARFLDPEVRITRRHSTAELFPAGPPDWAAAVPRQEFDTVMGRFASAFVRARKAG